MRQPRKTITMSPKKITVLAGSLRKDSFNRKFANAAVSLAPDSLALEIVEIGDLPFFNADLDHGNPLAEWVRFREQVQNTDGFLFFTPVYNRSVSVVMKHAIDVASRPYGENAWA